MRCCSGIKREIDDRDSPPPDVEAKPCFHGVVGEIAEGMIEEMRKYVGKHDEAAGKPHLANPNPAQPSRNARCPVDGAHIKDCRCHYSHVEFILPDRCERKFCRKWQALACKNAFPDANYSSSLPLASGNRAIGLAYGSRSNEKGLDDASGPSFDPACEPNSKRYFLTLPRISPPGLAAVWTLI